MAALGIHSKVFVGWAPDNDIDEEARHCRCRPGVIVDGPFMPGEHAVFYIEGHGTRTLKYKYKSWEVEMTGDTVGGNVVAAEHLLSPRDDGEDIERRGTIREQADG